MYQAARLYDVPLLVSFCKGFIAEHWTQVQKTESYVALSTEERQEVKPAPPAPPKSVAAVAAAPTLSSPGNRGKQERTEPAARAPSKKKESSSVFGFLSSTSKAPAKPPAAKGDSKKKPGGKHKRSLS